MAYKFNVWIDADSCPARARKFILNFCRTKEIPLNFVANREIPVKDEGPLFKMITCPQTKNAADDYITAHAGPNDFVVTRDIPFAARLVEKKISVINDRGTVFTSENIGEKLSERNFNLNMAELGFTGGRKSDYSDKDFKKFSNCFDREIFKNMTNETYSLK